MAKKKNSQRSSALSQKYVIDSDSDGLGETHSSVLRDISNGAGSRPTKEKQKKDRTASSKSVTHAESFESESPVNGVNDAPKEPSSSSEGSPSEEQSENARDVHALQRLKRKEMGSRPSPALLTPESPFRPPNGFHEVQSDVLSSTPSAFGAVSGDLSGKKVWHITAPTSVPLSSIKSFDVDAVRNGSPIFTYGRRQYGFSTASRERRYLLLPEDSSSSYKRLKTSISTSYHLREIPDEEQPPAEINFFAKTAPLPKPPPEQPKMLKMRYRAFGTGDNPSASTYVSESLLAEKAGFQHPVHPSSPVPEATSKKGKRHKRLKPSDQVEVVDDSMQIDESPARTSMVQVPSSQANISVSKTPHIISNAEEDKATPRRKKRKQKKLQGDPSS